MSSDPHASTPKAMDKLKPSRIGLLDLGKLDPDKIGGKTGVELEYHWYNGANRQKPPLVFLHEGLGCAALWRGFPGRLCAETGRSVLVYSRAGYGLSTVRADPYDVDYMHVEALDVLPLVLEAFKVRQPILIGHSDGASIALIQAALGVIPVSGLILESPHVVVEAESIAGIQKAKQIYETTDLRKRLKRHHRNADRTFWQWNDIWLDPRFRDWDIRGILERIECPVLAIQGLDDEYGTLRQIDEIEARVNTEFGRLVLPNCGHTPHRDQEEQVFLAMRSFVDVF